MFDGADLFKHGGRSHDEFIGLDELAELLDKMPTVDAVEVVRCKDCKWWKTNYMWNGSERKVCVIEAYEPVRNEEDYCSRGERREENG